MTIASCSCGKKAPLEGQEGLENPRCPKCGAILKSTDVTPAAAKGSAKKHVWKVGEVVHVGNNMQTLVQIKKISGKKAFVKAPDNSSGWAFLWQLRPVRLKKNQQVTYMHKAAGIGYDLWEATVLDLRDDAVRIVHDADFDNPGKKEWVPWSQIGVPCEPTGPGVMMEDHSVTFFENLGDGDRVWAPWEEQTRYAGTVTEVEGHDVHVRFDMGNEGWVLMGQVSPLDVGIDQFISCRWKGSSKYVPGYVRDVRGERVQIQFENGPLEWATIADIRSELAGEEPAARPTKVASRGLWRILMDLIHR